MGAVRDGYPQYLVPTAPGFTWVLAPDDGPGQMRDSPVKLYFEFSSLFLSFFNRVLGCEFYDQPLAWPLRSVAS